MIFPGPLRRFFPLLLFALLSTYPNNAKEKCPGGKPLNRDGSCERPQENKPAASSHNPTQQQPVPGSTAPRPTVNVRKDVIFKLMRKSVISLRDSSIGKSDEGARLLRQLEYNIAVLSKRIAVLSKRIPDKTYTGSDEYLSSLILDAAALGHLADRSGASTKILKLQFASKLKIENDEAAISILRDVAQDLDIKIDALTFDSYSPLACKGCPPPPLIEVTVRAKQAGREVNDYEVWYVAKGWANVPDAFNRFDNLSSPSTKSLAPGNYFLWLRKGEEKTERQPFKFGGDRQYNRHIDLVVP